MSMYIKLEELKNRDRVISLLQELSMAKSLHTRLLDMCRESDWSRVRHVVVKIGAARDIDPELLSLSFGIVSKRTPTDGADLAVLCLPIIFACHSCNREFNYDFDVADVVEKMPLLQCPVCGSNNMTLKSGTELVIEFLEVEKELPWQSGGQDDHDGADDGDGTGGTDDADGTDGHDGTDGAE